MAITNHLRDVTGATGSAVAQKTSATDSYEPATPGVSTRLIIPGPRMEVRAQIVAGARKYNLRDMFVVDLAYLDDEGLVFASHRSLPVHGYGEDQGEALAAFCAAFDFQWRHLVEVAPESLTEGGRQRRVAMQQAVSSVEEAAR